MAIFKTADGSQPRIVLGSTQLTVGAQGSSVALPANNNRSGGTAGTVPNRSSPTPAFQSLDQQIRWLDATYDTLTNQTDWEIYAINIAGDWDLCANCEPGLSGKKLFRQYNSNRTIMGLGLATTPVDNTEYAVSGNLEIVLLGPPAVAVPTIVFGADGFAPDVVIQPQCGLALSNPRITFGTITLGIAYVNGPQFDFGLAVVSALLPGPSTGTTYASCIWTGDGAPGIKGGGEVDWLL
jgi:hypothetical protein